MPPDKRKGPARQRRAPTKSSHAEDRKKYKPRRFAATVLFRRLTPPRVVYGFEGVILHPTAAAAAFDPAVGAPIVTMYPDGNWCAGDGAD